MVETSIKKTEAGSTYLFIVARRGPPRAKIFESPLHNAGGLIADLGSLGIEDSHEENTERVRDRDRGIGE